jgi:hypothetical protein
MSEKIQPSHIEREATRLLPSPFPPCGVVLEKAIRNLPEKLPW